jgi:hypothetical protein
MARALACRFRRLAENPLPQKRLDNHCPRQCGSFRGMKSESRSELEMLEVYLERGMQRHCLALARRLLRRRNINAQTFLQSLDAILVQADHLKRWRLAVERARQFLPLNAQKSVAAKLFQFYVALDDWPAASRFMPDEARSPLLLLFKMWTLLALRKMNEATTIFHQCERAAVDGLDEFDSSCLAEAAACFLAQSRDWDEAARIWELGTELEPFASNARAGLVKLHAYRGLLQARRADYDGQDYDSKSDAQLDKRFRRYASHFAKVIPAKERWRFGG